jgi:TM2 domain-containing membrane protein YozV
MEYGRVRAHDSGSAGGVLSVKTAAIVLNFFLPGVGSLVIGKVGQGVTQLILYCLGVLFTFTLIGPLSVSRSCWRHGFGAW